MRQRTSNLQGEKCRCTMVFHRRAPSPGSGTGDAGTSAGRSQISSLLGLCFAMLCRTQQARSDGAAGLWFDPQLCVTALQVALWLPSSSVQRGRQNLKSLEVNINGWGFVGVFDISGLLPGKQILIGTVFQIHTHMHTCAESGHRQEAITYRVIKGTVSLLI